MSPSQQLAQGKWPACIPVVQQQKDPVPSPKRKGITERMAWCHMMHTFRQNKGGHIEYETGKGIHIQDDKSSTSCDSYLSLSKAVFQARGPFFFFILFNHISLLKRWHNNFKEIDFDCTFFCQRNKSFWGSSLTTCFMLLLKKDITS